VLIIVTCRPSELAQAHHPFLPLKLDLTARGLCREISPGHLDETAIARYLALQFPEHAFPREFTAMLQHRTEGHPLFVVDLLRDLRRRQVVQQQDGRWTIAADIPAIERELPESMRSLVQRKIGALDDEDRRLLSAASVQGLDFDTAMIAAAADRPEEDVEDRLERLEREHALVRFVDEWEAPDRRLTLRYRFSHHVYQNALFEALRATRRAALARAVGEQLVRRTGPDPCDCAADIAVLFETARDNLRAAEHWNRAAQAAARLYAHDETERLAVRGLKLLENEPPSPERSAIELDLRMTYGLSVKTSRGYAVPEVGATYARARELCREVADPGRVVPVLIGLSAHHVVSGEIETSRDVAIEMVELFDRLGDPNLQMIGQWSLGAALFHLGELEVAHDHLLRGLQLYDPGFHNRRVWETGIDPGIFCRCELARTWTLLGYPDRGLDEVREAVRQARALEHPQPLAFALLFSTLVHLARREPAEVLVAFEELAKVCRTHGIAQEMQWGAPLRGRALVELGNIEEGLPAMEQGLQAHVYTRSTLLRPYYFTLLAGALLRAGDLDAAERALDDAQGVAVATGQTAYDSEHRRLQAEVLTARGEMQGVEGLLKEALAIARAQGSRWHELRAARGYGHFLIGAGRPDEARAVLQPVCDWFTDGRTTLDFVYAEALLKTLSS
jgi:adenylate cyclase